MTERNQAILLVEDSEEDHEAVVRALDKNHLPHRLTWCRSGGEALDYLKAQGAYANTHHKALPGLILLDINMPGLDGRRTLQQLKAHPDFRSIPVAVMSTSADEIEMKLCYELGAQSVMQKPSGLNNFVKSVKQLIDLYY